MRRSDRRRSRPDERPTLVIERQGQRQVVVHACERAQGVGVRAGMAVGDARGIMPRGDVRVVTHAPERIAARLRAVAVWAIRFAPMVAVDPPDGLLLDVSGCEAVWRGEDRLRARALEGLDKCGLRARAAIGPTFGAAWALARFGEAGIIGRDELRGSLGPLPVEALRLDGETVAALGSLGIERVEHLFALPRRTLPARFGPSVLLRLDQAMGEAIETIEPVRPVEPVRAERIFDGSTTRWDALEYTVRDLLGELAEGLAGRESGALRVEATLLRADLPPALLVAVLSSPSRDARHLWAILRPKLERTNLGFGVEGVLIVAARTARMRHEQGASWEAEHAIPPGARGELIDSLVARLGAERVVRGVWRASHVPERSAGFVSVLASGSQEQAPRVPGDRPTVLFEHPPEASVMALTPDGPVLSLSWGGESVRIERCIGPERIGPEWWVGDRQGRDYFKMQDDRGRWLWVFRESDSGRWRVHGVWA